MPAFLQEPKTGGHCRGVFQVHDLVDDWVVHGWGLCQQCGNNRHSDGDWVWLTKCWHHWHNCIRNPGYQEACTDQHCHLRTQSDRDRFVLSEIPLWALQKCFLLLLHFSADLLCLSSLSFSHRFSNLWPTFVSFISRLWLFLKRASKWEISFAEDLTLKMIMT